MENNIIINLLIILIGLVIGILIGYLLFGQNKYKGPDSNFIVKQKYSETNGSIYKWIPVICICPINLSMGKLKDSNYIDSEH